MHKSIFLSLLDTLLAAIVASVSIVSLLAFFVLGGLPKQYEIDEVGSAYASFLGSVEGAARDLRVSYCDGADLKQKHAEPCGGAPVDDG